MEWKCLARKVCELETGDRRRVGKSCLHLRALVDRGFGEPEFGGAPIESIDEKNLFVSGIW
jgi:hypothetical protein